MTESIFTTQTPVNGDLNDGVDYSLGTLFDSAVAGTIDGIRWFYPHTLPSSDVIGLLYSFTDDTNGVELARATFVAPVIESWNTVLFAVPVAITPGTKYVAAIWTPGQYVSTSALFAAPITNLDLTALADAAGAHNGRFIFSVGVPAYPNLSFGSNGYFVDVLFTPGAGPINVTLDQASEVDSARALSISETVQVDRAAEIDSASTLTVSETLVLNKANEFDSARPLHVEGAGTGGCIAFGDATLDWQLGPVTLDWQFSDPILCPQGGCTSC